MPTNLPEKTSQRQTHFTPKSLNTNVKLDTHKIARYLWIGRGDQHWYRDCQEVFIQLFGEEKLKLVCKLFAATSINTSLKSNITLFRRAFYEIEHGLPTGKYLPNICTQIDRIKAGEPLSGRKINNFANAMAGDKNAVVVDIWIMRAFNMDKRYMRRTGPHEGLERSGGPTDGQYSRIETYIQEEGRKMGLEPREFCAMLWAGVRIDTSGDKRTHYKEILLHKLTNLFNVI